MAGTLVLDTIRDGTGTTASITNLLNGGAKAWVTFGGMTSGPYNVVYASHNVSSVTRLATGSYQISYATPFSDNNTCVTFGGSDNGNMEASLIANWYNTGSYCNIVSGTPWLGRVNNLIPQDSVFISVAVFHL